MAQTHDGIVQCPQIYYNASRMYKKDAPISLNKKICKKLIVQQSPAVTLPPVTLYSQLRYFELGPKKFELSYFLTPSYAICSFFPPVTLFLPFSPQLSYFFAHVTRYVSTIRPRSQSAQDPSQPKIPVSPRSQSALDIVLNNLIFIIKTFESELLMIINQYVYQNYCSM